MSESYLEGFVHGTPGVLVCPTIDVLEELLQSGIALQLLILLILLDLTLQLIPANNCDHYNACSEVEQVQIMTHVATLH